ncbi:MAG TPA: hypothetical protein VFR29_05750 [Steroidobacteraceae bacterium]|nr:hypothetical protein [Steroidobacteraceae bacterium]
MKIREREGFPQLRRMLLVAAAFLAAAWLAACGGGGSAPAQQAQQVPPPPQQPGGTSSACPVEEDPVVDALAACGGSGTICVGYFDGSIVHDLRPLALGAMPAWSPDGTSIAFHRDGDLYLVNQNGTGERLLGPGSEPSWSPDGAEIAFTGGEGIMIMNADGTGARTLIRHDAFDPHGATVSPAWSLDRQRMAFVRVPDFDDIATTSIYITNMDGSPLRRLTSNAGTQENEWFPVWSPSMDRLAFNLAYSHGIRSVNANGADPRWLVPPADAEVSRSAWSPEGSGLAYTASHRCRPNAAIRIVDVDDGTSRTLVSNAREPAWSPDGTRIAFVTASGFLMADFDPATLFPPVIGAADVYDRETPGFTGALSRYVIYAGGQFELQFVTDRWGFFSYRGSLTRTQSPQGFAFTFDGDTRWQATGVLNGERLTVTYNLAMILSDFEDGVYVLSGD